MRFVVSTIGTSILTNQIDRTNPSEAGWGTLLRDSANDKEVDLKPKVKEVIETLRDRALGELLKNNTVTNRRISAELNGIYGIYRGSLPKNSPDLHYLICTDTAQGQKTGELIKDFLEMHDLNVTIHTPPELSTKDTAAFSTGGKNLIRWLESNVPGYRNSGYRVIFNLVGGFKSLQGYMNTFGAFYADEIIYIFEAPTSDLITIPRLPIQIDPSVIQEHRLKFALMAAGKLYPRRELQDIPETLLDFLDEHDPDTDTGLSTWGSLVWHRSKADLLVEELLPFPRLRYEPTFLNDFNSEKGTEARVRLQETLARVSYILERDHGSTAGLVGGGLRFKLLAGTAGAAGIHTFRIARGIRVSCKVNAGELTLRRYGQRNIVLASP